MDVILVCFLFYCSQKGYCIYGNLLNWTEQMLGNTSRRITHLHTSIFKTRKVKVWFYRHFLTNSFYWMQKSVNHNHLTWCLVEQAVALQSLDYLAGWGSLLGVFLCAEVEQLHHPPVWAAQSVHVQRRPRPQPFVIGVLIKAVLHRVLWNTKRRF